MTCPQAPPPSREPIPIPTTTATRILTISQPRICGWEAAALWRCVRVTAMCPLPTCPLVTFSDDVSTISSKIVEYIASNFKKACAFSDLKFALNKLKENESFAVKFEELKCASLENIARKLSEEQLRCYHLWAKFLFYLSERRIAKLLDELLDALQLCEKSPAFDERSYKDLQILAGDIIGVGHRR